MGARAGQPRAGGVPRLGRPQLARLPGGHRRSRRSPVRHTPDALAGTRIHAGLRYPGRRRPRHCCALAVSARVGWRRSCFGDGGLAVRAGCPIARGAAITGGLFALAGSRRGPHASPAGSRYPRGAGGAGHRLPAAAAHQRPPDRRPLATDVGAAPLANAGSYRHGRGAGRGVHRTVGFVRRCGRFAGRGSADG